MSSTVGDFTSKLLGNTMFKNFSYLTIGSALAQIISFFTVLRVTAILAPDDYGLFTFLSAQGMLLITVGDLGIRNIVIRSIARDYERTNDLIYNGILLRTLSLLILSALYIGYNAALGSLTTYQLGLVFAFTFVNCFSNLFENAFLGHERMLPPAIVSIAHSILWFLAVFYLPVEKMTPNFLFVVFLVLHVVKGLILYVYLVKYGLLQGKVQAFWASSSALLKESWPYFLIVLVMLPFSRFANNFLDINSTAEQVGYFNLSTKLTGPVSLVLDFSLAAIFPNLSSLWVSDKPKLHYFISNGFQYFMLVGLFLCFGFSLFVREVVTLLFPASYLPAVVVCQMQIWYLYLTSIDSFVGTILGATDKERFILQLGIVNAIFTTPLLFFGSKYGALGLSYGFVIGFA
ncbi:MAG: oligosaccharide flippase family protein, partial [Bacteroidota bacterium]